MDGDMMIQFRAAAELLQKDDAVRVVVLRGEGPGFIAGGDVGVFHRHLAELPELIVRWGREMHFAVQALRRMPKPVLASVHGACAGAGFSILCAADLAIAADNARFSLAYANIGTSPDGGSSYFLPRLVGYKKAMELTLLPDLFDATTAQARGLVNWVVPLAELAQETARIAGRLANGPTRAYAEAKRLLNDSPEPLDGDADGGGAVCVRALRADPGLRRRRRRLRREAQAAVQRPMIRRKTPRRQDERRRFGEVDGLDATAWVGRMASHPVLHSSRYPIVCCTIASFPLTSSVRSLASWRLGGQFWFRK